MFSTSTLKTLMIVFDRKDNKDNAYFNDGILIGGNDSKQFGTMENKTIHLFAFHFLFIYFSATLALQNKLYYEAREYTLLET